MEALLGFGGLLFIAYAFFHACACCHVAGSKGYDGLPAFAWFVLGGLFGVFALLAIGLCETVEVCDERRDKRRAERKARREERVAQTEGQRQHWEEQRQRRWAWLKRLFSR